MVWKQNSIKRNFDKATAEMKMELKNSISQLENSGKSLKVWICQPVDRLSELEHRGSRLNKHRV